MSSRLPNILVVDDEHDYFDSLRKELDKFYRLIHARNAVGAQRSIQKIDYDLVLLDLVLEEGRSAKDGGLKLLPILRSYKPDMPIIIVTKHNETKFVVEALKLGAADFLWKDDPKSSIANWKLTIDSYLAKNEKKEKVSQKLPEQKLTISNQKEEKAFIGISDIVTNTKKILVKLASKPDVTVLLTGETGVGKEVAAEYMHRHGARKNRPFKAINLTTLTKTIMESRLFGHRKGTFTDAKDDQIGLFEEANGGILFLDEIGEIDGDMQVKLLRFLQEKVITPIGGNDILLDVQIVAATNKNLDEEVAAGRFREDLYYRLNHFKIEIPPLRKRREDIKVLLDHYLKQEGESVNILTDKAEDYLFYEYSWPGNIRELINWVKSTCLKLDILEMNEISELLLPRNTLKPTEELVESSPVAQASSLEINPEDRNWQAKVALEELKPIEIGLLKYGRKGRVGKELGLSMDQLRYKVEKHFEKHPEIFEQLPEIAKKYKLNDPEM